MFRSWCSVQWIIRVQTGGFLSLGTWRTRTPARIRHRHSSFLIPGRCHRRLNWAAQVTNNSKCRCEDYLTKTRPPCSSCSIQSRIFSGQAIHLLRGWERSPVLCPDEPNSSSGCASLHRSCDVTKCFVWAPDPDTFHWWNHPNYRRTALKPDTWITNYSLIHFKW
jgi:hypothetical protein